jgi:hypothetical protein
VEEAGKKCIVVTVEHRVNGPNMERGIPFKSVYLVDPDDHLPKMQRKDWVRGGEWVQQSLTLYEYPSTIDPGIFEFRPGPDMQVIDRDVLFRDVPRIGEVGRVDPPRRAFPPGCFVPAAAPRGARSSWGPVSSWSSSRRSCPDRPDVARRSRLSSALLLGVAALARARGTSRLAMNTSARSA